MQRTSASRVDGAGCPSRCSAAVIRAGMSPGGRNAGSFGSTVGPPAGRFAAPASRRSRSAGSPASAHVRMDSWRSHSPITLRRKRTLPSTPRSFVKFAARLASVTTGPSSSTPTRPQVPHEM